MSYIGVIFSKWGNWGVKGYKRSGYPRVLALKFSSMPTTRSQNNGNNPTNPKDPENGDTNENRDHDPGNVEPEGTNTALTTPSSASGGGGENVVVQEGIYIS
jgi:hypothetical protein